MILNNNYESNEGLVITFNAILLLFMCENTDALVSCKACNECNLAYNTYSMVPYQIEMWQLISLVEFSNERDWIVYHSFKVSSFWWYTWYTTNKTTLIVLVEIPLWRAFRALLCSKFSTPTKINIYIPPHSQYIPN